MRDPGDAVIVQISQPDQPDAESQGDRRAGHAGCDPAQHQDEGDGHRGEAGRDQADVGQVVERVPDALDETVGQSVVRPSTWASWLTEMVRPTRPSAPDQGQRRPTRPGSPTAG